MFVAAVLFDPTPIDAIEAAAFVDLDWDAAAGGAVTGRPRSR